MDKEIKTVSITLGNVTKSVEIFRYSDKHCWICMTAVIATFPTGAKTHQLGMTTAHERCGIWSLSAQGFRNANRASVRQWADQETATSKW